MFKKIDEQSVMDDSFRAANEKFKIGTFIH